MEHSFETAKDIMGAIFFLLLIWGTSYLFLLLEAG